MISGPSEHAATRKDQFTRQARNWVHQNWSTFRFGISPTNLRRDPSRRVTTALGYSGLIEDSVKGDQLGMNARQEEDGIHIAFQSVVLSALKSQTYPDALMYGTKWLIGQNSGEAE